MCLFWCLHPWNQRVDNLWFLSPKTRGPLGNHYLASTSTLDPLYGPTLYQPYTHSLHHLIIKWTSKTLPLEKRLLSLQFIITLRAHVKSVGCWPICHSSFRASNTTLAEIVMFISCLVISNQYWHFRPRWQAKLKPSCEARQQEIQHLPLTCSFLCSPSCYKKTTNN